MTINNVGNLTASQIDQIKKNVDAGIKQVEDAVKQKENKQKLALTLGALGAVGAAAVGIAMKVKKGKGADVADMVKDGADKLKKAVTNAKNKVKITIGEELPFDKTIKKVKCGDELLDKSILSKYSAKVGDKDVVFEQISYGNDIYDILRDKETNKIIKAGRGTCLQRKTILAPFKRKNISNTETILKTSKKSLDKAGNEITETFKNGKLFSKQTTIKNPDGSKQIIVEYGRNSKKIIDIAKDGTKATKFVGDRFYNM